MCCAALLAPWLAYPRSQPNVVQLGLQKLTVLIMESIRFRGHSSPKNADVEKLSFLMVCAKGQIWQEPSQGRTTKNWVRIQPLGTCYCASWLFFLCIYVFCRSVLVSVEQRYQVRDPNIAHACIGEPTGGRTARLLSNGTAQ